MRRGRAVTAPLGEPRSDERKEAVRRYFQATPAPADETRAWRFQGAAGVAVVLAVALLVVGLAAGTVVIAVVAVVLFVQGRLLLAEYRRRYAKAEPKPRDADMDMTLRADLRDAAERAMQRLELTRDELELHSYDASQPGERRLAEQGSGPLVVFGPADRSKGRPGVDRVWRFTSYDLMAICPTGHHLAIYRCRLTFDIGGRSEEDTDEYHYADVVAISTRTRPTKEHAITQIDVGLAALPLSRTMIRAFEIVVSSSDRSSIAVSMHDDDQRGKALHLQESGIDQVIRVVRHMLREKKGGVASATGP